MNFTDLHDKLFQYKSKLIKKTELDAWMRENIKVVRYLPLETKYALISILSDNFKENILNDVENKEFDITYSYMVYDMNVMFTFLFKYVGIDVERKYRTIENYNLIIETGLYDFVMRRCKADYDSLVEKCDRVSGINNLNVVADISSMLGKQLNVEDFNSIVEQINTIDTEKLDKLTEIQRFNDPIVAQFADVVKRSALEEAVKKQKEK